jgi:hypothetical protein
MSSAVWREVILSNRRFDPHRPDIGTVAAANTTSAVI